MNARRGANHPICSLHERALCVLALGCVDEVILGAPAAVSADLIRSMNISLVVGGADESTATEDDRYAAAVAAGCFQRLELPCTLRIDDIVQRIITNRTRYERRHPNHLCYDTRTSTASLRVLLPCLAPLFVCCIFAELLRHFLRHFFRVCRYERRNSKREKKEIDYIQNQKQFLTEL